MEYTIDSLRVLLDLMYTMDKASDKAVIFIA